MKTQPAPVEHYDWIAQRAQLVPGSQFRAIEIVNDAGQILGMVGFDGWLPNAVSLHIAIAEPDEVPHESRRDVLNLLVRDAFGIAFNGCGKGVAIATVLSNNERSKMLVHRVGFRLSGFIRDAWAPGVDLLLYEMRREECRWLEA